MNITMKPLKLFYCPNIPNHDDIEKHLKLYIVKIVMFK